MSNCFLHQLGCSEAAYLLKGGGSMLARNGSRIEEVYSTCRVPDINRSGIHLDINETGVS